tara:strand:- start:30771 stop:33770 length:3000 start_codon:yes stop_codon:yes gene_type:complete
MGAGASSLNQLFSKAAHFGMPSLAITDTNGLHGAILAQKAGDVHGVKTVIGTVIDHPSKVGWPSARYAVLLAQNEKGYREICRLVTRRQFDPDNFSLPGMVAAVSEQVIVISSDPETLKACRLFGSLQNRFAELTDHTERGNYKQVITTFRLAKRLGFPTVATNNVHFADETGYATHKLLTAIRTNRTVGTLPPGALASRHAWLKPADLMEYLFREIPEATANTIEISQRCNFRFELGVNRFPVYNSLPVISAKAMLGELARGGLTHRYQFATTAATARLEYELDIIDRLGFNEYFLIVRDIVNEAKRLQIPTVGRGSAANSLVCFCLGITEICPLKYNLYFERFLNPERRDKPDIDLDFPWNRREEILRFIYNRYGEAQVAIIGAHVTYRGKGAIREVGKAFGMGEKELSYLAKRLPSYCELTKIDATVKEVPEFRGLPLEKEPYYSIIHFAKTIEGFPRCLSTHCSGIVVTPEPIESFSPLEKSGRGLAITQLDMYGIDDLGLVKIDILGQRALAVVSDVRAEIEKGYGIHVNWDEVKPVDDEATKQRMRDGATMGCFYIESPAMRGLLQKLLIDDFETLVAASSIIRPGVSNSGMMKAYINRHVKKEKPHYFHPVLKKILEETYGVMVYQEDVMKVLHAIAGMSLGEADALRRLMSKRKGCDSMRYHKNRFIDGAKKTGLATDIAEEAWRQIESFGSYAFCKAHSASFAVVSWQTAYLKSHYPAEFMAAVIANHGGFYTTSSYIEEARRMGIVILPPDVNRSDKECTAEKANGSKQANAIRTGLIHIKGLSQKSIATIQENRPYLSLGDFLSRGQVAIAEAKSLAVVGAFDSFGYPRPALLSATLERGTGRCNEPRLIDTEPQLPVANPYPFKELLKYEHELLGFTIWAHPLAIYRDQLPKGLTTANNLSQYVGKRITLVGWLVHSQRTNTVRGRTMKFLTMEDETAIYEATLFPRAYQQCGHHLSEDNHGPFIITGSVQNVDGHLLITGEELTIA